MGSLSGMNLGGKSWMSDSDGLEELASGAKERRELNESMKELAREYAARGEVYTGASWTQYAEYGGSVRVARLSPGMEPRLEIQSCSKRGMGRALIGVLTVIPLSTLYVDAPSGLILVVNSDPYAHQGDTKKFLYGTVSDGGTGDSLDISKWADTPEYWDSKNPYRDSAQATPIVAVDPRSTRRGIYLIRDEAVIIQVDCASHCVVNMDEEVFRRICCHLSTGEYTGRLLPREDDEDPNASDYGQRVNSHTQVWRSLQDFYTEGKRPYVLEYLPDGFADLPGFYFEHLSREDMELACVILWYSETLAMHRGLSSYIEETEFSGECVLSEDDIDYVRAVGDENLSDRICRIFEHYNGHLKGSDSDTLRLELVPEVGFAALCCDRREEELGSVSDRGDDEEYGGFALNLITSTGRLSGNTEYLLAKHGVFRCHQDQSRGGVIYPLAFETHDRLKEMVERLPEGAYKPPEDGRFFEVVYRKFFADSFCSDRLGESRNGIGFKYLPESWTFKYPEDLRHIYQNFRAAFEALKLETVHRSW